MGTFFLNPKRSGRSLGRIGEKVFEDHIKDAGMFIGLGRFRPASRGRFRIDRLLELQGNVIPPQTVVDHDDELGIGRWLSAVAATAASLVLFDYILSVPLPWGVLTHVVFR